MEQATIIGIDLAKRTFQLHGAAADGSVAFRKKLPQERVLLFLAAQPPTVVDTSIRLSQTAPRPRSMPSSASCQLGT
jgi:hypothetical protein